MNKSSLKYMKNGWFIGNFEPAVLKTNSVEVAVKKYMKGEYEERHYHKEATEITVIVEGKVIMNDNIYTKNDIIVIEPNEDTDFKALEDTITVVVKHPGVNNDKYLGKVEK